MREWKIETLEEDSCQKKWRSR